jgi:hypothetical protein
MSDFLGSATVPVASVGVPPTESFSRNLSRPRRVSPQAHREPGLRIRAGIDRFCLALNLSELNNCPSPTLRIEIFDAGGGFINLPPRPARAIIAA